LPLSPNASSPAPKAKPDIPREGLRLWLRADVEPRRFAVGGRAREASPRNFNGQIAEILIYNRVLKDDERRTAEESLAQKYDIALDR
jgi:hypothetical protein